MPWLMKAEPDTRLERGIDVKFSVDDFQQIGISKWDGVRNHEAKKIMKEKMKVGDEVLFYHSNCKVPGVYGIATVHKEGYPDYTAWDEAHPYYDAKSKQDTPTWFMVDVEFKSRVKHPVTLALLKLLAGSTELPEALAYIGDQGLKAIKEMALVNRGRLSVQPVTQEAYEAILLLGEKGGWEDAMATGKKPTKRNSKVEEDQENEKKPVKRSGRGRKANTVDQKSSTEAAGETTTQEERQAARPVKRRKVAAKPKVQDDASGSDLSDLPSSDMTEDEQISQSSVAAKVESAQDVGKTSPHLQHAGGERASSGTRRSARQQMANTS